MMPEQSKDQTDASIVAEFPLSASQTRCWIIDRATPGTPILNVAVRWRLDGPLASADLERAFRAVIDRHEILRTAFAEVDGAPVQRVYDRAPFQLSTVDLRPVPPADQPARVDAIARETAAEPFDLSQPGLIRAVLIRLTGTRAILCYVVHQSCFDGFSIRVLGRDLGVALIGEEQPDLPLQYGDYTLWQQEYFASGALEEEQGHWTGVLADAPYFEVPPDHPRPSRKSGRAAHVTTDLSPGFGPRLTTAAQAAGLSKFAFGCAIFSAALHRITGAPDVLFGTQIAGRLDEDLEPLIGVFINNLVLRFGAAPGTPLAAHIAAAKQVVETALINQSLPFNKLVEALNPPRDPSRTPLISINFNLQSVFMETRRYGDVEMSSVPSHAPGALYDLDMAVMERPGGWQITLEYAEDLFDPDTARQIVDTVVAVFDAAFDADQTPLGALPLTGTVRTGPAAAPQSSERAAAEDLLTAHPMVAEAVTLPDGDGAYGFVVPQNTGTFPLQDLPQAILGDLPPATVTGISVLADFPRTSTGAPNRSALRVPETAPKAAVVETALLRETLDALRADWADLLDMPSIPGAGHFFDLGGHSLLVLRLLSRLRDRWGVSVDLAELYQTPVLRDFARLVADRRGAAAPSPVADPTLLRLRADGAGQPLIAINNAATALALSTLPGQDRPVSCVTLPETVLSAETDFIEVAQNYRDRVRRLQPKGPYLFYGNCVHGNLALETARLLQAEGEQIAGVVMKDVWEPAFAEAIQSDRILRRLDRNHSLRLRLKHWRQGEMSTAALLGSYGIFHRTGILRALHALRLVQHANSTDLEESQERFITTMSRARDRYRPEPIHFPVLHVVTQATPSGPTWKPSIGWEDVVAADALKTVHLKTVYVSKSTRIGVEDLAHETDLFLAARQVDT